MDLLGRELSLARNDSTGLFGSLGRNGSIRVKKLHLDNRRRSLRFVRRRRLFRRDWFGVLGLGRRNTYHLLISTHILIIVWKGLRRTQSNPQTQ